MHESHTNVKWEYIPFELCDLNQLWEEWIKDQEAAKKKSRLRSLTLSSLLGMSCSGCSGLEAYLEYNESKVAGCFVVPIYGADVTSEESAPKLIECPKPIKVIPVSP